MHALCKCEKCHEMIEVECRIVDDAIIIEPRQDVVIVALHKPFSLNERGTCGGLMKTLVSRKDMQLKLAQERLATHDPQDDTLYEVQERILSLYRDGHEMQEIMTLCDCDESDLRLAISTKSIRQRRAYKRIVDLKQRGLNQSEIASKLETTQPNVSKTLARYDQNFFEARRQPSQDCEGSAQEKKLD